MLAIILFLAALASRICLAYFYPVDGPGDGVVYAQLAKNLLEQGVFSVESDPPFSPTLVRLPGYPLFIAAVYSVFGHDNNTAVRVVQAVFDSLTCVIIALLAWLWTADEARKRRNAFWAFLLASLCPFIAIYDACILTETMTTFLMAAIVLTTTLALRWIDRKGALLWWALTGLLCGAAVFLRPDSGLCAMGVGLTLVISYLFLQKNGWSVRTRLLRTFASGGVFGFAFLVVLVPWTIRNERLFAVFQPLAPAHAQMPGEFVAYGYFRWLRTWVDDSRFTEPMLWDLDEKPIRINKIPNQDFDSPEERDRVAALLDQYNKPPGYEKQYEHPSADDESNSADDNPDEDKGDDTSADDEQDTNDEDTANADNSSADESDDSSDEDDDDGKKYVVKMTPEVDAQFGQIADERIARSPLRYYLFLPAKRAATLWFDSHSLYYPFGGQMSPIKDLDYDVDQQYWLPSFTLLMWIYTFIAIAGVIVFWRQRADGDNLQWLLLVALVTLPRIIFFSTVENPEPRYLVELFAIAALLGGFWIGNLKLRRSEKEEAGQKPNAGRLLSLDVLRGIAIAGMVLVDDQGNWSAVYAPLSHAEWHGATPADLVFPLFLFIVGVSIAFALGRQRDVTSAWTKLYPKVIRRSVVLFALGLLLEIFPFYNLWTGLWFDPSTTRIMGVLQRIAICYLVTAIIFLHTNWKQQTAIVIAILLGYWLLMTLTSVPGCAVTTIDDKACNLAAYVDRSILGAGHIWNELKVIDPEGLLSTLPAIATTLLGVLTGQWLRSPRDEEEKVGKMLSAGTPLTMIGWLWSLWFPLNKMLWTSSFVVYTAGMSLCFFAVLYWLMDLRGYQKWAAPFLVLGSNAILLFVGSSLIGKALETVQLNDGSMSLQEEVYTWWFAPLGAPATASLLYAIAFIAIFLILLWPLYRWKIFLKV